MQGVELDCRDVIVRCPTMSSEEEWSVIELRDKEPMPPSAEKSKHRTPIKSFISGAASSWTGKGANKDLSFPKTTKGPLASVDVNDKNSILMSESSPVVPVKAEKGKRKMFHDMFRRENHDQDENRDPLLAEPEEKPVKSTKKQWGLEGLKKWKRGGGGGSREGDSTTSYLPTIERSDDASSIACTLVAAPIGQGPDTKRIKSKIHFDGSASDFIIDKVRERAFLNCDRL